MTTYNTGNPVGSTDVRDLYDNAQNLDSLVNGPLTSYADRLGAQRKSWRGIEQDFAAFLAASGFELPALEYVGGTPLVVDRPTQLIFRTGFPDTLYGVKSTEPFPATLSGTWSTDEGRLVVRSDGDLRQDLANSTDPAKGAGLVGFDSSADYPDGSIGHEFSIIIRESERHIYHYLSKSEQIDSRSYNPQIDTTAKLNDALNDGTINSLRISGGFKVSGSGQACLTMTRNISIRGENVRSTFIRADGAGAETALLSLAITNNGGMGDVRGWEMDNISLFHNGGGSHVISNESGLPMFNTSIRNCNFSAGTAVGARDLIATKMAFSVIERNTFGSGVTWGLPGNQAADGSKFLHNMFFGTGTGLILDIEKGAYCTEVYGGTMVNRDGGISIIRGDQIRIRGVQFEHAQGQGASQSPEKAHIAILGTGQQCDHILIEANNLGGGTNLDYLVWVNNAVNVDITRNFMNAPGVADVYLSANALYTKPRVDNIVHGSISNPRNMATRFPMVVVDNGYGTYNVTKSPALANGWVGGAFHKSETDEIVIETGFNAGTNVPGTLICTLPDGFKPADFYMMIAATSGGPAILSASPDGNITLTTTGSNAGVASQVRFSARRG